MSDQLTFYKLFAEKQYNIEIPIIQRDYAQGRKSASEVRSVFLDAIYNYLVEAKPFRDLDFIYGDIDNRNNFVPLDGQQRLTTLFLLHWFLAISDGKMDDFLKVMSHEGFSRFTYKTRQSAADFCNALLNNQIDLNNLLDTDDGEENALSKTIQDSPWYFLPWNNDPTVQSMLRMLDAIHEKFANTKGFYDALVNAESPIITFQFLELKDYGLTDDLYIKMNSRGKPLTKFENFKAKYEQHLATLNAKLDYKPNIHEYFANRIDTRWADLFWTFRDVKDNVFDKQLMNFISVIAINHYALNNNSPKQYIDHQENLSLSFYLSQNEFFVTTLVDTLDLLSDKPTYQLYIPDFYYYDEIAVFKRIINNNYSDAGYVDRIKFFAYYSFLSRWKAADSLADWMRVIVNLTENTTPYNSEIEFISSLRAIHRLLPFSNRIIEHLQKGENITGFNPVQVKEEQIKAHLISKSEQWSKIIYEAEKHPYFKGQLIAIIAFSGIEAYYDHYLNCDWTELNDNDYFNSFNHYWRIIFSLFDTTGLKLEAKENHKLQRALLSKGNYLINAKSNLSFLNDSDRDVSWKRFLQGDGERQKKRGYLKQLLDDPSFRPENLVSLEAISNNSLNEVSGWRRRFIEEPKALSYLGSYKYIRYNTEDEIYLLSGVKMNGDHAELFTYSLFQKLQGNIDIAPFNKLSYYSVNTDKEEPCIFLYGFSFNENEFELDINYDRKDVYKLAIFDRNKKPIADEIVNFLVEKRFIEQGNYYQKTLPELEIIDFLTELFNGFRKL